MSDVSTLDNTKQINALYDENLQNAIDAVVLRTEHDLLPYINLQPDKTGFEAALTAQVAARSESAEPNEAFIAPNPVSSLPSLVKCVHDLEGFMLATHSRVSGQETNLTACQAAAGALRWESFNQFMATVQAIHDVATDAHVNESATKILRGCKTIQQKIAPSLEESRRLDTVFLGALDEMTSNVPAITGNVALDQFTQPLNRVSTEAKTLEAALSALPPEVKAEINARIQSYKQQCERGLPDDVFAAMTGAIHGMQNLSDTLASQEIPSADKHAVIDASVETSQKLRELTRALSSVLNTMNESGRYDEIVKSANSITANAWVLRCMDKAPVKEAVSVPSTQLTEASAAPVASAPEIAREA